MKKVCEYLCLLLYECFEYVLILTDLNKQKNFNSKRANIINENDMSHRRTYIENNSVRVESQ